MCFADVIKSGDTETTPEEMKLWSITVLIKHILLLLSYHDPRMLPQFVCLFFTSDFYRQTKVSHQNIVSLLNSEGQKTTLPTLPPVGRL